MLLEEEKKAIEDLKDFKSISILYGNTFTIFLEQLKKYQEATDTVLNLIEKLQTDFKIVDQECSRLERKEAKQDKMIDLMAEELQTHMFVVSVGKTIIGKKGIKEYYEQKATNKEIEEDYIVESAVLGKNG